MVEPLVSDLSLCQDLQSDSTSRQNYVEAVLTNITADVLRVDLEDLDRNRSFLSLGGDSITAIKMMARCKAKGITLNVADMIDTQSITELCQRACRQSPGLLMNTEDIHVNETSNELHKLSMLHEVYAETGNTEVRIFRLNTTTPYNGLHVALASLVERHPMLRVKLTRTKEGHWMLQRSAFTAKSFTLELHAVDTNEELVRTAIKLRTRLTRPQAPVFGAIAFEMASGSRMLALAAHCAAIDATSWKILATELASHIGDGEKLVLDSRYFHKRLLEEIPDGEDSLVTSVQYSEKHYEADQDKLIYPTSTKTASEQEKSRLRHLVINETDTALLLDRFDSQGDRPTSMDIVHSALAVAASTTTSNGIEDILFCDIHEDRSKARLEDSFDTIGCFDLISQLRARLFPSDDHVQLLGKMKDLGRGSFKSFEDGVGLQQHSGPLTPPSEPATHTVVVDARQLKEHSHGAEDSVQSGSHVVSSSWLPRLNQKGSPLLSVSLLSTNNTIRCFFLGDTKWHDNYDLEDFIHVFKASMSGILRRLRNSHDHATVKDSPLPAFKHPALDVLNDDTLKQILRSGNHTIQSVLPCSPVQEKFLISQSTNPRIYQCCFVLKFTGHPFGLPINAQQVGSSWREVVKRHTILRTVLLDSPTRPGQFDQVVLDGFVPAIEFHDWTHLSSAKFSSRESVPFQRFTVPHRVHLAQATANEVYMKLEISHVLVDGQSTDVILRDLCAAYRGIQVSTPAIPYEEFVTYQRQLSVEQSRAYWLEYLSDAQPTFLPMDRGHEALSELDTLNTKLEFAENFLPEFCGQYSVTLSNICQLAWGLVLRSFTGSDNVTFSYITSGRSAPLEGLHDAVGPFVSTLICNIKFDGVTPIEHMLRQVSKDSFEGLSHLYGPDSEDSAKNDKSARRLGNTTMSFQRVLDMRAPTESAIHVSVLEKSNPTDYDIAVGIEAQRDALSIDLDFWRSRMNLENAKAVLKTFRQAIHWLLQTPYGTSSDVSLLGADDRTKLQEWNHDFPRAMQYCLHEKVAEITQEHPEAPAVCAWDGNLTYGELTAKAATLAHRLVELGVVPESVVGLCMDKSKWAIISMLAILQAGGVVVPLGVSHPLTRIDGIVSDTEAKVILVDKLQAGRLAELAHTPLLLAVNATLLASLPPKTLAPNTTVTPDNAAWVIFTSGSTGTPKGVLLEHKSLSTSVQAHGTAFGVARQTRTGQFAAYTFDVSISDVFTTLHHGGCVCVFSEESRMNNLTESLQDLQVNYVNLTPTVLRLLDPANTPQIKTAVVGGEPLDPKLVERWTSHAKVINSYGPSECAIISTCYSVSDPAEASIIGFPTATRLWVTEVTNPDRLCPIGVPGELLIDGPLLARGYLNDASKTAASFITNPLFAADLGLPPNLRFYRTGDLVRQNENGSLSHLGRLDTQVKIRGQRVEIGEIEHWIMSFLNETRMVAAVVTNQGQQNEQIGLVAVVEFSKGSTHYDNNTADGLLPPTHSLRKTFDELRTSLFEVLPAYMVPSLYLPVSQMPLNPSGKLDRRAVKQLIESIDTKDLRQYITDRKVAVSTETERELQLLWSQALGISEENVGADDHFLQIGGDSLAAIRIVAAARESHLHVHMTVADILQHPRLSELAQLLDSRASATSIGPEQMDAAPFDLWKEASEMQPGQVEEQLHQIAVQCGVSINQIEDVYPCTPLQEGLIAITARQPTAYISCQVFSLAETVDVDRFQGAWQKIAESAPILRTRILFRPQSTSLQIVIRNAFQWRQHSSLENYLRESRGAIMASGEPLNEFGLVEEASGERFFVWISHHSTYDSWSMNLMLEQVAGIYRHNAMPRFVPYTRFISYLSEADPEVTKKYWQDQLHGDPVADFPPLPYVNYHPRPRQRVKQEIDLHRRSRNDVIISDVLRAAWALVLAQHARNDDPVFAVALSGRDAPVSNIANLLAPTFTTVPLRIHIDSAQSVRDFLEAIRKQRIGIIPHQHTGLRRIKQFLPDQEAALNLRHIFVVQPEAQSESLVGIPGMQAVPIDMEEFDSYGLNVECWLGSNAVTVDVRFDKKMIAAIQVERMLEQFALVIKQFCNPAGLQRRVGDIEYLSPKDIQQINEWNKTLPSPVKSCIHQQVAETARLQPDAPAVCAWDGNLTYNDLIAQAATLSHHLLERGMGVGPERMIGLCMDKSKWAVVAMLAILQTGGVVVPLGVNHPITRISRIMSDTAAHLILVDQVQAKRLNDLDGELVTVDSTLLDSLQPKSQPPSTEVTPDNAAWVIFTSGSTGIPKGVVLEHTALATSIRAHGEVFGFGTDSRVYQFAAHTFDAVIQDCFTTLIWGGTVCISSEDDRMNNLAAAMRSMAVTFVCLTSTVAGFIVPSEVPTLRTMVLGGEPVQVGVVETWYKHVNVFNAYGPSECSIYSTYNGPITDPSQASNIGYPIGNRLWVSQPSNPNQLCPIGVTGELLIEGPLLARGYLNDHEKTAAAFVTDPAFTSNPALGLSPGSRVYRTGDLVRQNEDGSLTYISRCDTQIKLRGQRVEIGEIESWISKKQPDVRLVAVAVTSRGGKDQQMLVAVIELASDSRHRAVPMANVLANDRLQPPTDKLREEFDHLRTSLLEVLPAYMVPNVYVPVSRIPLNVSGKLDRRAAQELIDAVETSRLLSYTTVKTKTPPSTEMERQLQMLWRQILGEDMEVGAHDHFFHIGGDSVAAMRIVAAARSTHLRLTVADIFQYPRLSELALVLDSRDGNGSIPEPQEVEYIPFEMWKEAIGL